MYMLLLSNWTSAKWVQRILIDVHKQTLCQVRYGFSQKGDPITGVYYLIPKLREAIKQKTATQSRI